MREERQHDKYCRAKEITYPVMSYVGQASWLVMINKANKATLTNLRETGINLAALPTCYDSPLRHQQCTLGGRTFSLIHRQYGQLSIAPQYTTGRMQLNTASLY